MRKWRRVEFLETSWVQWLSLLVVALLMFVVAMVLCYVNATASSFTHRNPCRDQTSQGGWVRIPANNNVNPKLHLFHHQMPQPRPNLSQLPPTLADLQCPMMKQVPTLAKSSAHCMAIFKYVLHQPSVVNQWSYLNILSAAWQRTLRTANITTWVLGSTWPARGTRVSRRVRRQWQLGALHTVTTRLGTVTGTEMRPDEDLRNIRQVSHQQNFTVSR